ncbi:hypothetical protein TCON_2427 [Astathelohania contejeani]|uniref:Uncharacterized protein n=1 Tax=Astathelohania contejeani TaxID=164912 RepID=A0ABQ7HW09_9MICR|nr:hypothetical protein TCON_2427 [Thelohania contejeani]
MKFKLNISFYMKSKKMPLIMGFIFFMTSCLANISHGKSNNLTQKDANIIKLNAKTCSLLSRDNAEIKNIINNLNTLSAILKEYKKSNDICLYYINSISSEDSIDSERKNYCLSLLITYYRVFKYYCNDMDQVHICASIIFMDYLMYTKFNRLIEYTSLLSRKIVIYLYFYLDKINSDIEKQRLGVLIILYLYESLKNTCLTKSKEIISFLNSKLNLFIKKKV